MINVTAKEAYELWQKERDNVSPILKTVAQLYGRLDKKKDGTVKSTTANFLKILKNDPTIAPNIRFDSSRGVVEVVGHLPWFRGNAGSTWVECDVANAQLYIDEVYDIKIDIPRYHKAFRQFLGLCNPSFYDRIIRPIYKWTNR